MNYLLGVELSGNQIKVSVIHKKGSAYELAKLDSLTLPSGEDSIKILNRWIAQNLPDPTNIKAILTVSESSLYIKEIEFPEMDVDKLNEAVYWEIPSLSPIPQADSIFDWKIITKEKGIFKVLVVVGKASYIQNIIATFRKAQIDVIIVEPASYAFARVANAPFNTDTLLCLAEEKGMDFIIIKNGIPYFTTSISGQTQIQKVAQIKSQSDLTEYITTEGKKIINYWESKENTKIEQVVVGGDLVYKFIGLNISLNLFPPLPSYIGTYRKIKDLEISAYKDTDLGSFLISIGAAARHLQTDVFEGLNLIPATEKQKSEEIRHQKKSISQISAFLYSNLFILVGLILTIMGLYIWWYSLERQSSELKATLSTMSAGNLIGDVENINKTINNVTDLTKQPDDTGRKLKLISDATPQSVSLTSVNFVNTKLRSWTIEGIGDRDSILVYYKKLSELTKAKEIDMSYSNFEKDIDNSFSINLIW